MNLKINIILKVIKKLIINGRIYRIGMWNSFGFDWGFLFNLVFYDYFVRLFFLLSELWCFFKYFLYVLIYLGFVYVFYKYLCFIIDFFGILYDYSSVMYYEGYVFSLNRRLIIVVKK